jgi:hypothetical protein
MFVRPFFDANSILEYTSNLFYCGEIILQPGGLDDFHVFIYCVRFKPILHLDNIDFPKAAEVLSFPVSYPGCSLFREALHFLRGGAAALGQLGESSRLSRACVRRSGRPIRDRRGRGGRPLHL